jgi:glycosyltransferase involved in cell wall biosynthesis
VPYKWWLSKPGRRWKPLAKFAVNLAVLPYMVNVLADWKCDIVYTNTVAVWVGAVAARVLRRPHIWHVHEFGREDHGMIFDLGEEVALRIVDNLSTIVIANSKAVAQKYQKYVTFSKLRVVYYSVRIPYDRPNNRPKVVHNSFPQPIRCVIVGRLDEGKGQAEAIQAVTELIDQGLAVSLVIVGDGDNKYRQYLERLISERRANGYVKIVGYTDNPYSFIKGADVVLVCSRSEAFGRVTVEAMKLGKPVIGTRAGGTAELIEEGFNGLLYSPGNYRELADKIRLLAYQQDLRVSLGENGRRFAEERFTDELYAGEILRMLRGIVGPGSGPAALA